MPRDRERSSSIPPTSCSGESEMRHTSSSTILTDHDASSVHMFLERDLRDAQRVDFSTFMEAVFGLSPDTMRDWTLTIREQNWLEDPAILQALEKFCEASEETKRYDPLVAIINRIMELARGTLSGVSETYPIDDICIRRNDPVCVQTIPEHGPLGAQRKPDLVIIRAIYAKLLERLGGSKISPPGIKWSHSMVSVEVKFGQISESRLEAVIQDRRPKGSVANVDASSVQGHLPNPRKRSSEDDFEESARKTTRSGSSTDTSSLADGPQKSAKLQMGSYALETLACTYGTRLFCVNTMIDNDRIHLWYYDACGAVRTQDSISLLDDFETVAALIVGIANSTPEHLGALPSFIKPPPSEPYPKHWPPKNLKGHTLTLDPTVEGKEMSIVLKEPIFTQYCLAGRRTFVYAVESNRDISNKEMIVKLSYQVDTRKREQDLVMIARKAGVKHLPQIHLSSDLYKISDGVRRIFREKAGIEYEDRTLRMIVYSRYFPLQTLIPERPECIRDMTMQMIECLHDLKEKANILHRDISVNNIMYELREGKPYFVLIDYDMAVVLPQEGERRKPHAKYREGTLPFMAVELLQNAASPWLEPVPHFLRHDYEALFYLSVWLPSVFMEPKNKAEQKAKTHNIAIVRAWETREYGAIAKSKKDILRRPLELNQITLIGKAKCLESFFMQWNVIWRRVDQVYHDAEFERFVANKRGLAAPTFDHETVEGLVTRDFIVSTLNADLDADAYLLDTPSELFNKHYERCEEPERPVSLLAQVFPETRRRVTRRTPTTSAAKPTKLTTRKPSKKKADKATSDPPPPTTPRPRTRQSTRTQGDGIVKGSKRTAIKKTATEPKKVTARRTAAKTTQGPKRPPAPSTKKQRPVSEDTGTMEDNLKKSDTCGRKPTVLVSRKATSKKVKKITKKSATESPLRGRRRPSPPVKEAEVEAAAKRADVKKKVTRTSSRIKEMSETTKTKSTGKPTVIETARTTTRGRGKTKAAGAATDEHPADERLEEMDGNDIRMRLRPRKRT